jgi:hypothetical protein
MPLTVQELNSGIRYWRTKKCKWPQDFHNRYYKNIVPKLRPKDGRFDLEWWNRFYPELQDWAATRKGGSRADLTSRVQQQFEELGKAWSAVIVRHLQDDIANVEWRQIASFPPLVTEIKWLVFPNPMFTSKFCHFLVPCIFPVSDKDAVGNPFSTYEKYYTAARGEWLSTDTSIQSELVDVLTEAIGEPVFSAYPMKCKLIELCLTGRYRAS